MIIPENWKKEIEWTCNIHKCSRFIKTVNQILSSLPFLEYHEIQPRTRRILESLLKQEYEVTKSNINKVGQNQTQIKSSVNILKTPVASNNLTPQPAPVASVAPQSAPQPAPPPAPPAAPIIKSLFTRIIKQKPIQKELEKEPEKKQEIVEEKQSKIDKPKRKRGRPRKNKTKLDNV